MLSGTEREQKPGNMNIEVRLTDWAWTREKYALDSCREELFALMLLAHVFPAETQAGERTREGGWIVHRRWLAENMYGKSDANALRKLETCIDQLNSQMSARYGLIKLEYEKEGGRKRNLLHNIINCSRNKIVWLNENHFTFNVDVQTWIQKRLTKDFAALYHYHNPLLEVTGHATRSEQHLARELTFKWMNQDWFLAIRRELGQSHAAFCLSLAQQEREKKSEVAEVSIPFENCTGFRLKNAHFFGVFGPSGLGGIGVHPLACLLLGKKRC